MRGAVPALNRLLCTHSGGRVYTRKAMTTSDQQALPVVLDPILVERIWGVHNLAPWHAAGEDGSTEAPIGEIWLTAETCKAASGTAEGQTLAQLTEGSPEAFGDPHHHGFPLLIKLLFPREKLSVQVHPNDEQARALGMPRGKTECWYVLSADPGAQVAVGFKESLTTEEVAAAIRDGSLENKLRMIDVKAGDMVFVEAGTVHAIGPRMVVLETQQYSDTTYRLWDYGRPRELHVEAGMAVTRTDSEAGLVPPTPMDGFTRLASSAYFAVDRFTLDGNGIAPLGESGRMQILIALVAGCTVQADGGETLELPRGQAVVLPVTQQSYGLGGPAGAEVVRVLQP